MDKELEFEDGSNNSSVNLTRSDQVDTIERFYKINVSEPITELNTELYKYFLAKHLDSNEEYYAIVFERHNCYTIPYLNSLKGAINYSLIPPIAFGVTKLSSTNEFHLVVIVPKYNHNNSLSRRLINSGVMSYEAIVKELITPITYLLQYCEKNGIEIGNLSPHNIIFTDDNKIVCREFYISPPHYFQDNHLLAPEIVGCVPAGRVTLDISSDIYAFGIVLLCACSESQIWIKHSEQQYNLLRLENGTFNTLVGKLKLDLNFKNLLKGLLNDDPNERWKVRNIIDWLNGKAHKAINIDHVDAISPIIFNDTSFQNCKALAYSMHINWEQALQLIKEERLTKWVQRSLVKSKITESINEIFTEQANYKYSYNQDRDEHLFKLLVAFDPSAPIRLKTFAANLLSISNVICISLINRRSDHLEPTLKIMTKRFWYILVDKNNNYARFGDYFQNLDTAVKYYNPAVQGFTIERMLYWLNPNLPCLSNNLGGNYVTSIAELLSALNNIVASNHQAPLVDRHITGYIACKINLKRELKISSLRNYPQISQHPAIIALNYIFLACQQAPTVNVNNLGSVLASRLIELFNEYLHNTRLKNSLKKDLLDHGASGNFTQIINIISDSKLIESDFNGYKKACREAALLNAKINALKNRDKVNELGVFFGQRITVLISYLLIVLVCLILIF